jgi:hypothetical protein
MKVYVLTLGSLHDYEVGEPKFRYANAPIHVNIIMFINMILHHCMVTNSDEKEMGDYSTRKGKMG